MPPVQPRRTVEPAPADATVGHHRTHNPL